MSEEIIDEYIEYLSEEKNLTKNTLSAYIRDIKLFEEYLKSNKINKYLDINKTTIITYLLYLQKKGRATSTISRNLASIRSFSQYLLNSNKIKEDPTLNLKALKIEKKIPDILTIKEINTLLDQPNINNCKGARDKAMLELLYAGGLRVSEAVSLNIKDLDLELGIVYIKNSENIKRLIPIGKKAIDSLLYYIKEYREKDIKSSDSPLFINYDGNRLSRQGVWKTLREYAKNLDIKKKITPHTIRHSFAVHLIENGADLKTVQEILGHSDLSTTQIYSFASEDKNLRQVYRDSHPRA